MDEPKRRTSRHRLCGRIGADAAPIAVDLRRPADLDDRVVVPTSDQVERLPDDPKRESSLIVYCDGEQEIREGFAIALRAMGVEANFLRAVIVPPATSSNREDN
jgi:hypothetical protein